MLDDVLMRLSCCARDGMQLTMSDRRHYDGMLMCLVAGVTTVSRRPLPRLHSVLSAALTISSTLSPSVSALATPCAFEEWHPCVLGPR
jgi:hypothetical protein